MKLPTIELDYSSRPKVVTLWRVRPPVGFALQWSRFLNTTNTTTSPIGSTLAGEPIGEAWRCRACKRSNRCSPPCQ
jgi:hypothetical protein